MFHKTILFSVGLLTLASCNAQKGTKTSTKIATVAEIKGTQSTEGNIIYFNEGENKFLKEYQMSLTFKSISEDSRCPTGVNCIWIGAAVAQVEVMGVATRPATLSLATVEKADRNYHQSQDFNGYSITLAEVTPYPTSQNGTSTLKGKYRIGIIINKEIEKTGVTTK